MVGSTLQPLTTTREAPDRTCIRNPQMYAQWAISATLDLTNTVLADTDAQSIYIGTRDFIPVGTLLAHIAPAAGPAYQGLWVPYLPNITVDNGEATADGIVFEPIYIRRDSQGTIDQTTAIGSILPANVPVQVFASKMPQYDDHTGYTGGGATTVAVAQADLPAMFQDLEALGVTNLGGL